MTERARVRAVVAVLVLALGAGACGGDDDEGMQPTATPGTAPAATSTAPEDRSPTATTSPGATGGTEAGSTAGGYVVQPGDTLSSIAQEFGTTVDALVEANGIEDPDVLDVGQQLTIPGAP